MTDPAGTNSTAGGGGALVINTTTITGGTDTRVFFQDGTVVGQNSVFTFTKATGLLTTTALALGGATIGTNALAVTGTATISGVINATGGINQAPSISATTAGFIGFNGRSYFDSPADGSIRMTNNATANGVIFSFPTALATPTLQLGAADVASGAVAQTLQPQSNTGATTTGPLFLVKGAGGGSGAGSIGGEVRIQGGLTAAAGTGGAISFYTAASGAGATPVLALTISSAQLATFAGQVVITNVTSDAAATDTTACLDTTSKQIKSGSGTLGICLGTSGRQFKTDFAPMQVGLNELMQLPLQTYHYLPGYGDGGKRVQYGLVAQDVEKVMPALVGRNASGDTINYDYGALLFVSIKAIQELEGKVRDVPILLEAIRDQQIMIDELTNRLDANTIH